MSASRTTIAVSQPRAAALVLRRNSLHAASPGATCTSQRNSETKKRGGLELNLGLSDLQLVWLQESERRGLHSSPVRRRLLWQSACPRMLHRYRLSGEALGNLEDCQAHLKSDAFDVLTRLVLCRSRGMQEHSLVTRSTRPQPAALREELAPSKHRTSSRACSATGTAPAVAQAQPKLTRHCRKRSRSPEHFCTSEAGLLLVI